MKKVLIVLLSLLYQTSFTQNDTQKSFKNSSNKFYVGINVAPLAVGVLAGQSFLPEYKFWYKQRLTEHNHYLRLAYSYILDNTRYFPVSMEAPLDGELISDSVALRYGYSSGNNNVHTLKFGYEYQYKIGKKRYISVNLGVDGLLGLQNRSLYFSNDTLQVVEIIERDFGVSYVYSGNNFFDRTKIRGPIFIGGASPFLALGFPVKKTFDITLEMAFDIFYRHENYFNYDKNFLVYYRPSLMFSFRFDEKMRKKKRN